MIGKKKKKKVVKVICHFDNHEGNTFQKEIEVPPGCSFSCRFASDPKLVDECGNILKIFDWKAGFTVVYEYIYDDEEGC